MNETSGNVMADAKNSNPGQYNLAGHYTLNQAGNGLSGAAVQFESGASSWADVADAANLEIVSAFSVELMAKFTSAPSGGRFSALAVKPTTAHVAPTVNYGLGAEFTGNHFWGTLGIGSTQTSIIGTTSPSQNVWYHLVTTWDGSLLKLYLNGSSDATAVSISGTLLQSSARFILNNWGWGGGGGIPSQAFGGQLSNVAVYNAALSSSAVLAHFNAINGVDSGIGAALLPAM